jgi:hypothetical protein
VIALFGHSGSHAPQLMHSSVILVAMLMLLERRARRAVKFQGRRRPVIDRILPNAPGSSWRPPGPVWKGEAPARPSGRPALWTPP